MADPTAIIDAIKTGDYDDELGTLLAAVFDRAVETETGFSWQITLDDDVWNMETVTGLELSFVERALSVGGRQFSYLDLDPIKSMEHLVTLVVAHLHHVRGMTVPDAFAEARKYAGVQLSQMVTVYEVKATPKDDGTTSTI